MKALFRVWSLAVGYKRSSYEWMLNLRSGHFYPHVNFPSGVFATTMSDSCVAAFRRDQ